MVSLIIDIALAIVTLIIVIRHARLGFIKSILGTFKPIIAGVIAFVLRVPVAKLFKDLFFGMINGWTYESLSATAAGAEPSFDLVSLYNTCPIVYEKGLVPFGLDMENGFRDSMANITQLDESAISELSMNISSSMAWALSLLTAMVLTFIIALLVLTLIITLLNLVTKLAVLNIINRILGIAVGLFWSLAFALFIAVILTFVSNLIPNVIGADIISESIILGLVLDMGILNLVPGLS